MTPSSKLPSPAEPPARTNGDAHAETKPNGDVRAAEPVLDKMQELPPPQRVVPSPPAQAVPVSYELPPLPPKDAAPPPEFRTQLSEKRKVVANGAVEPTKMEAANPKEAEKAKIRLSNLTITDIIYPVVYSKRRKGP